MPKEYTIYLKQHPPHPTQKKKRLKIKQNKNKNKNKQQKQAYFVIIPLSPTLHINIDKY